MTTLHLGVIEQPYSDKGTISTGDVAQILEDEYGVMSGYVYLHKEEIAENLAQSASDALENMMMGAPPSDNPFAGGLAKIREQFQFQYLEKEEIVLTGASGVPTQAALAGKSQRFKRKHGPRRPSFVDSALYENSFVAWIES